MTKPHVKKNRRRRSYSRRFKAEMVARCLEGTESIASLAVAHAMNPILLHHWMTQHRRYGAHDPGDFEDNADRYAGVVAPKNWVAVSSCAIRNTNEAPGDFKPGSAPHRTVRVRTYRA